MSDIKVFVSAPIDRNLYSLLVSHLCVQEPGVELCGILTLNVLSLRGIRREYRRLGRGLLGTVIRRCSSVFQKARQPTEAEVPCSEYGLQHTSLRRMARTHEIPYLGVVDPNDRGSIEFIRKCKPDLILAVGSVIMREPFLATPAVGVLNVHMGILPEYRGIGVTEWPIIEGRLDDVGLGVTLHFMDAGVDTGPILMKRKISTDGCDSLADVESKYLKEMVEMMIDGVRMVKENGVKVEKQSRSGIGRQYYSTHPRMRTLAEKMLLGER